VVLVHPGRGGQAAGAAHPVLSRRSIRFTTSPTRAATSGAPSTRRGRWLRLGS
jgi:hypothetical protein